MYSINLKHYLACLQSELENEKANVMLLFYMGSIY